MKKLCINDFSSEELKSWLSGFYPNGLNRFDLEKASNIAKIKAANRKISLLEKNELFEFNDDDKIYLKPEVRKLKRLANKYKEAESDFVIARSWDKKELLEKYNGDDKQTMNLLIALNTINFESEILKPGY